MMLVRFIIKLLFTSQPINSWKPSPSSLNPSFQLSTRDYEKEMPIVRGALLSLQTECNVQDGYTIDEPFGKFGWTFFNIQLSDELVAVIEKSGMMAGAAGFTISEQITNFVGHYLEGKGSNVRIKKIDTM